MSVRGNLQLAFLFVIGLGAGIWTFVAPWVIQYPTPSGAWTSSIWAATWVGAAISGASALGLVVVFAAATHEALKARRVAQTDRR